MKWDGVGLHFFLTSKIMLIGEYVHTLDPKKRLSLPSRFRKEVGKKVVITRGLDHCLFVYTLKQWEKLSAKLAGLPMGASDTRGFSRFMLSGAVETDVDANGRVLIPDFLKSFGGLREKVVVIGAGDRIEIWDDKKWGEYKGTIEKQADTLAEKLGDIGAI